MKKDYKLEKALEDSGVFTIHPDLKRVMDEYPPLDIYAPPGTKVRPFYLDGKPQGGYDHHAELVAKHLKEGGIYTIESIDAGNWHTDVYLEEVPGVAFNSVLLSPIKP